MSPTPHEYYPWIYSISNLFPTVTSKLTICPLPPFIFIGFTCFVARWSFNSGFKPFYFCNINDMYNLTISNSFIWRYFWLTSLVSGGKVIHFHTPQISLWFSIWYILINVLWNKDTNHNNMMPPHLLTLFIYYPLKSMITWYIIEMS